jgi:Ala-tRNA(Pro) deacylase
MTNLQSCTELLDKNHVHYMYSRHAKAYRAREFASAEQIPAHIVAKVVVFCCEDCFGMAVLPADCIVDLEKLAIGLGTRHVRLATEEEIAMYFPAAKLGALPPFGELFYLPVYMDERLAREKYIAFNGGTPRDSIYMTVESYVRVARPLILRFARPLM